MKSVPRPTVSTSGRKIQDVFKSNNSQSLSTGRTKIFNVQSIQAVELMTRPIVLLPKDRDGLLPFTSKEGLHSDHSLYFTQCPFSVWLCKQTCRAGGLVVRSFS